jgi:hypothetical protein
MQDDMKSDDEPLFSIEEETTWPVAVLKSMELQVPWNLVYVVGKEANHLNAAGLNLPKAAPGMVYVQFNSWQVLVSNQQELEAIQNIYNMETAIAQQWAPQIPSAEIERMRASVYVTPEHFPVFVPAPKMPFQVDHRWLASAYKVMTYWMVKSDVAGGTPLKLIVKRGIEALAIVAGHPLSVEDNEPESINISDKHIN